MLKKLSQRVAAAVKHLVFDRGALALCEKRIAHFEERLKVAEQGFHKELEDRARAHLSYWRIRRTKVIRARDHWRSIVKRRRRQKKRWLENHPDLFPPGHGGEWVIFDGHEVPLWMAVVLQAARESGVWTGAVFSGRRTKQYSEELCENMCGAPSCPGRCAGTSSNHVGPPTFEGVKWEGAADVTDPYGLRHYCETHGEPLVGGGAVLPADIVHFSHEGN